ncbi:MAG TPA: hypothetical protein VFO76_09800, partial [Candidatus Kapabacteria bacterium]|nr:hypothetical protein [Candidatus Kapabacteria bacterium]
PTSLTFAVSTPYVNNLPTGRGAGQKYLFIARTDDGHAIASATITLMPGDKWTWAIFDVNNVPDKDYVLKKDNPPANAQNPSKAYFRFFNTLPQYQAMRMRIGDALHGEEITLNGNHDIEFMKFSDYYAIDTLTDTTVTFFVLDNSDNVVARIAGVSLEAGSYRTITFNGYGPENKACRKPDPITNQLTNEDTLRIHIYDDNSGGNDQLPVPTTLRFNIINAMIPADPALNLTNPYSDGTGVSYIINNNTSYDFKNVKMYQGVPTYDGSFNPDSVQNVYPKAVPYTGAYVKVVKATGAQPSGNDPLLMRFFANTSIIASDQLYSIVVFDAVQKPNTKAAPYDSAAGVATFNIPDAPIDGKAIILVGSAALAYKKSTGAWTLSRDNSTEGTKTFSAIKKEKQSMLDTVSADVDVTFKGSIKYGTDVITLPEFTFRPKAGGIYEVLGVGRSYDPLGNTPRFIVIRTNPIKK